MRTAVIGHVEWVEFVAVDRPPEPGAILRAPNSWAEPAGGGGVAAAELARLAGACTLYTALGNDSIGVGIPAVFAKLGVSVEAMTRDEGHRRAFTMIDPSRERTIVVIGAAQAPVGADLTHLKSLDGVDALYLCKGDVAVVRAARKARILVATARMLPELAQAGVSLDALVLSARDPAETYLLGQLNPPPKLVARTDGADGGTWELADGRRGTWAAQPLAGEARDSYGAGDSFAAGLAYGLATGLGTVDALQLAAKSGARALCRRGAHGTEQG